MVYAELVEEFAAVGMTIPRAITIADALQEVLGRAVAHMRIAATEVDRLKPTDLWAYKFDAQGNRLVEPSKWLRAETVARKEVLEIASRMAQLDIDGRRVAVEEAEALFITRFLDAVLDQLNLTDEQRGLLGPALDNAMPLIEGVVAA